ncbi:adhesion G protein-coupled receptor E1-like [Onychostoma macrolepis]|uniref:adhesion G protein-coupled receptor E1-like n=1 Tax=Onychostoma macrolepis TaxID=369639 RepID=UPI00272D5054|nr:adhesion G protein-coupled receptor E1-like [Onychostoma macrolepis]
MFPNTQLKWTLLLLGLFLQSSESRQCGVGFKIKNKICVDEDECSTSNQCGDHAQCVNTPGSYYCTCNEGFRSATANFTAEQGQCEDINECVEKTRECTGDMVCVNKCICRKGYRPSRTDSGCDDVDECLSSVCGVHSSCTNTPGSFFCICSPGFHRHENNTCTDINESPDPDVCGRNAQGFNHSGGYSCKYATRVTVIIATIMANSI